MGERTVAGPVYDPMFNVEYSLVKETYRFPRATAAEASMTGQPSAEDRVAAFKAEVDILTQNGLPPRWEDIWKNMTITIKAAEDAAYERAAVHFENLPEGPDKIISDATPRKIAQVLRIFKSNA